MVIDVSGVVCFNTYTEHQPLSLRAARFTTSPSFPEFPEEHRDSPPSESGTSEYEPSGMIGYGPPDKHGKDSQTDASYSHPLCPLYLMFLD
jgi:hypothetical protein